MDENENLTNEGTDQDATAQEGDPGYEFDYSDAGGAEAQAEGGEAGGDEGDGGTAHGGREATNQTGSDAPADSPSNSDFEARIRQAEDRATRAERMTNRLMADFRRIAGDGRPRTANQAQQAPKARRPETVEELLEFVESSLGERTEAIERRAQLMGRLASSEQRARGILTRDSMGPGLDYDSVVDRYLAPLEQENPALSELIDQQSDPALARYTLGLMHEITEKFAGNPIKAFQAIRNSLKTVANGERKVLQKIDQAAKAGAAKVRGKTGGPGTAGKKTKLDDKSIWDVDDKTWASIHHSIHQPV